MNWPVSVRGANKFPLDLILMQFLRRCSGNYPPWAADKEDQGINPGKYTTGGNYIMKKIVCFLLVLCFVLSFAACKKETGIGTNPAGDTTVPEHAKLSDSQTQGDDKCNGDVSIAKTVIYDKNGIKIILNGLEVRDAIGFPEGYPCITLTVENNSNQKIGIYCQQLAINGVTFLACLSGCESILPGRKAFGELAPFDFTASLDKAGIEGLNMFATLMTDNICIFDAQYTEIDRCGFDIKTTAADDIIYKPRCDGKILYEDENFVVKYLGNEDNGQKRNFARYWILLENKGDIYVDMTLDDIFVNDFPCKGYCSAAAYPGMIGYGPFDITDNDLKDIYLDRNMIEKISFQIEFDNWDIGYRFITDEITLDLTSD